MTLVAVIRRRTSGHETMFAVHREGCRDITASEYRLHDVEPEDCVEAPEPYQRDHLNRLTEHGLRQLDAWLAARLYPGGDVESVRSELTIYPCTAREA